MKLADLNPSFDRGFDGKGYLSFDCPKCGPRHRIENLPTIDGTARNTGVHRWGLTGEPPDWDTISLTPSVNFENDHWHGFITGGQIVGGLS